MMKLTWRTEDSGLGWKYHKAETDSNRYTCEPEDLDFGEWQAFVNAGSLSSGMPRSLGSGTWRECRAMCEAHATQETTP